MRTLFDDLEDYKPDNDLKIIKKKTLLSKNQKLFNKLTQQIETLENTLEENNIRLNKLLNFYIQDLKPIFIDMASKKMQVVSVLDKASQKFKLKKKQYETLQQTILRICEDAFIDIEPDAEQEAIFDKWSEISYREGNEYQEQQIKENLSDMMKNIFKIDINPDELDDDPEAFINLKKKLEEQAKKMTEESVKNNRKKTKKQIEKEEKIKEHEEIKNKNIRSIYITLAKVLHPDSEQDPILKTEKEEVMKQVTMAYDQKDIATLLKLEIEWIHKTNDNLEKITDDKLKIFIAALKEQAQELQEELFWQLNNPRYAEIADFIHLPEPLAIQEMQNEIKLQKNMLNHLTSVIENLKHTNSPKFILDFAKKYLDVTDNAANLYE
jgi:hypothetical protein